MRQTARAVLINQKSQCFLALHNHIYPENIGKWGTVGGLRDSTDIDLRDCLRRELTEEFHIQNTECFEIFHELLVIEKYNTAHHFFLVQTNLDHLEPIQKEEIIESKFFTLNEVKDLKNIGKLYFGYEDHLYDLVLKTKSVM